MPGHATSKAYESVLVRLERIDQLSTNRCEHRAFDLGRANDWAGD